MCRWPLVLFALCCSSAVQLAGATLLGPEDGLDEQLAPALLAAAAGAGLSVGLGGALGGGGYLAAAAALADGRGGGGGDGGGIAGGDGGGDGLSLSALREAVVAAEARADETTAAPPIFSQDDAVFQSERLPPNLRSDEEAEIQLASAVPAPLSGPRGGSGASAAAAGDARGDEKTAVADASAGAKAGTTRPEATTTGELQKALSDFNDMVNGIAERSGVTLTTTTTTVEKTTTTTTRTTTTEDVIEAFKKEIQEVEKRTLPKGGEASLTDDDGESDEYE